MYVKAQNGNKPLINILPTINKIRRNNTVIPPTLVLTYAALAPLNTR